MKQKQLRGGAYLIFSVLKRVKERNLFNIQFIEVYKGEEPILAKCNEAETVKGRSLFNITVSASFHLVKIGSTPLHASMHQILNRLLPFTVSASLPLAKIISAIYTRGGAYLIFDVLKSVKGRSLF
jgi:hypothetical protein